VPLDEAQLLAAVIELCDGQEPPIRWIHVREARREPGPWIRGFPDLLLIGECRAMFRELKAGGDLHGRRQAWLV